MQDIPDYEIQEILKRVRDANTEDDFITLNTDEAVVNILTTAGFVNKLLSKQNRDGALETAMIHFSLLVRRMELQDIRRGMEIVSMTSFLQKRKYLWDSKYIFPRSDEVKVTAKDIVHKIVLHSSVKHTELDASQKLAFDWCKEYIHSLPVSADDKYAPTTGRFLQFVLGSPEYPEQPIYIRFNRIDKALPDPEACLGILSLPVDATKFKEFNIKWI